MSTVRTQKKSPTHAIATKFLPVTSQENGEMTSATPENEWRPSATGVVTEHRASVCERRWKTHREAR